MFNIHTHGFKLVKPISGLKIISWSNPDFMSKIIMNKCLPLLKVNSDF